VGVGEAEVRGLGIEEEWALEVMMGVGLSEEEWDCDWVE